MIRKWGRSSDAYKLPCWQTDLYNPTGPMQSILKFSDGNKESLLDELAALMHIYARFSTYRIFATKKRCISCNICTKSCHMGIDVMNYANKGIPMNDIECVRCSSCIINCPMQVLSFGDVGKIDINYESHEKHEKGGSQ